MSAPDTHMLVGNREMQGMQEPTTINTVRVPGCRSDKSKHLSVVWKKLALHVRHVESLVVAKFDGSANEHAMVAGTSFPSVWLYPAGSTGKGVKFTGEPNTKASLPPVDFTPCTGLVRWVGASDKQKLARHC